MDRPLSDLVRDTKLEVEVYPNHTVQITYVSNPATGQRRTRLEQRWQPSGEAGRGSFGYVRLETCSSGPETGQVRAVKELWKSGSGLRALSWVRELEAVAKFSQERVRKPSTPTP